MSNSRDTALRLSATSRAVAIEVLVHGAQSRARLAEKMGLSAGSLTRLVKPLLAAGLLVEANAVRSSQRGPASLPLDVVADDYRFVGVKVTTSRAYGVVTDLRARVIDRLDLELASVDAPEVTRSVMALVTQLRRSAPKGIDAVGVTVGGQVSAGEVVADSPYLHWHEVPFRALLGDALALPVYLDNDVVGLTRAQHWFGSGREYSNFAMLTVGAGIGYGLVIDDAMVRTPIGLVSHYPIDASGPVCVLGHRGCLTAYLTIAAITSAVSVSLGRTVTFLEVLELATGGEPVATRIIDEAAWALGRAAGAVTALTGVEHIILSGEGVHLVEVARPALERGLREYQTDAPEHPDPVIHPVDFFEWARGAAVIAIQQEFPPNGRQVQSAMDTTRERG